MRFLLSLLLVGCVARSEPSGTPRLGEPPFTFVAVSDAGGVTIALSTRMHGELEVLLTRDGAGSPEVHERLVMRSRWQRYTLDPRLGWTLEARWIDPHGVAGASTVLHVPDVPRAAPRFEAMTPRRLGVLRIDEAVRPAPR